jgi:hypothetical protein
MIATCRQAETLSTPVPRITNILGRKVREAERERERENNGANRGHYVLHQRVQRQPLAHSLRSPKIIHYVYFESTKNHEFL